MIRIVAAALALCAAQAHAYCIHNETDREITVLQDTHPNDMRNERRLNKTLAPRAQVCCEFHNLDCNPEGRNNSLVTIAIAIPGTPAYACGMPEGSSNLKVTGAGTIRVQPNSRQSAFPYVVRVQTQDSKDTTGPRGVACIESKRTSPPPQKGSK